MSVGGSQQQRLFRRAIRDGRGILDAAIEAGIGIGEARLLANEDVRNPPPPEAYELLVIPAAPAAPTAEEPTMVTDIDEEKPKRSRRKKQDEPAVEIVQQPDFERAARLLSGDITPAEEKNARERGKLSAAWKVIEDECHVNKKAAKDAHRLAGMSDELREDYLRSFYGMMKVMNLGISRDLVDQMGDGEAPGMPVVSPEAPELHTLVH